MGNQQKIFSILLLSVSIQYSIPQENNQITRRISRSFRREDRRFIPRRTRFKPRKKEQESEVNDIIESSIGENEVKDFTVQRQRDGSKYTRGSFKPSSRRRNKYRPSIRTEPTPVDTLERDNSDANLISPTPSLRPTNDFSSVSTVSDLDTLSINNLPHIISSIDNDISGDFKIVSLTLIRKYNYNHVFQD